ncbi:hypothetical protein CF327_g1512 [Tilletia walkeri]|nr:hypothetical protein CF327_g1512 [Tilletia walkeri]
MPTMSAGQSAGQHRISASSSRRPSLTTAITTDISLLTSTMMRTTQSAATSPTAHDLHLHSHHHPHIISPSHSRSSRSAPTSPRLPIRTPLDNDQHTINAHFAHRGLYVRRVKRGSSFTPLDDPHGSSSTLVSDQQSAAISGRHSYAAPSREYQQHLHSLILSPPTSTRSSSSTRRGRTTPSSLTATPEASDGEEEEETEEMDTENTGSRAHQQHHHYRSTTPRRSHARQSSSTSSSGSALGLLRHTSDTPSSFKHRSPNSPFSSGSGEEEADQSLPHLSPSSSLSSMHSSSLGSASGTNSSSFSAQQHESPASSLYHDPALPMGSRERKVGAGVGVVSAFPPVVDVIAPSPPTPHSNPQRTQHARPITTGPTAGQRFVDGMHAYEQSLGGGQPQQGYPPRPSLGGPSSRTKRRVSFDLNARARSHQPVQVYQQQQQQQVDVLLRDATAVEEEDLGLRRRNVGVPAAGSRSRRPRTMSALPDLSVGESKSDGHHWASHSLRPLPPQEQQRWTTSDPHSGPSSPAWIQQQDESSKMRGRFGRAPSAHHHHHRPSPSPSPSRSPLPIPRSGSRSAPTSRRPSSQALDELFQSDALLRSRRHPHPHPQHVRLAADEEDIEGVYGRGSTGGSGSLAAAADMGANAGARARAFFSGLGLGSGSHAEQVHQEGGGGGADPAVPRVWETGSARVGRRPVSSAAAPPPPPHTGSWSQFREGDSRGGYRHPSRPFGASSTTATSSNPRGTTFEHTYESLYGTQHHLVSAGNALAGAQIMSEEALLRTMSVAQMQLASAGNLALTLTRQLSEPLRPMFHVALLIGISSFTLLSLIAFMSVGYGLSIWDDVSSRAGSVASNPSAGVLRASARKNVEASVRWGKRMLAGSLESAFVLGWGSAALDESINGAASASASASASAGEGVGDGEKGKSAFESGKTVPPPPPGGPGFSRASGGRRMRTGSMPSHVPWAAMHAQNVPSSSSTPGGGSESKDKPAPPTSSDEYDFHAADREGRGRGDGVPGGPTTSTFPPRPPLTVLIPSIMLTLLIAVGASLVRMFIQRQQQQQQQKVDEEKGESSSTRREAGRRRYQERERERGERPMRSREQRREEDRSRPSTANQDLRRPSGSGPGSHRRTRTASSAGMGRAAAAAGRQEQEHGQGQGREEEEEEVLDEDGLSISLYRRGGSVRAH